MHQQKRFIIPQKLEDLLHLQEDHTIFYVNDELTSLELAQKLPETQANLKRDPLNITEEFSFFFSVLKNFNKLDSDVVNSAWVIIYKATDSFKEQLREVFTILNDSIVSQASANASQEIRGNLFDSLNEKLRYSNSLKMLVFICCTFMQHFEDALSSQTHRQNFSDPSTPARRRKKQSNNDDTRGISFEDYDRYKDRVMKSLLQIILMPLNKVAESASEARDIAGHIMRVCYKMVENASINGLTRNKNLLEYNFSLLGCGIEKYNQSLSFCLKFIQLLQYKEQLAPMLADLFEFIVTRHNQRLLVGEILREIDRIDVQELSRDSSCPRAVSTFLVSLSEKCPQEFLPSIDHLFGYLEQDSYIMRNASLAIMTNLIIKVLHKEDQDKTVRDELLDALLRHICDMTGYTRSKALSSWCTLCENQCLPLSYLVPVTEKAVRRLKDKVCLVRKNAVRFIISVLSHNPFARRLPLLAFLERFKLEKALLDKLSEEEREKVAKEEEVLETLSQSSQNESITDDTRPEDVHPCLKIRNLALTEESALVIQQRKVTYLQDVIIFTRAIHRAIPITTELLFSKSVTDVQEAIDFFVYCHEFGIDEALVGFKRMILLINVQEKSIKDKILLAYKRIFFESGRYEGKPNRNALVVSNFINFIQEATIGESLALEKLINHFVQSNDFNKDMERELWARFTKARPNTTVDESIAAIILIGMLASSNPDLIHNNLQPCLKYGLSNNGCSEQESRLVRETCIAIRKSLPRKLEDKRKLLRYSQDHVLFVRLTTILVDSFDNMSSTNWLSMCDEIVRVLYDFAEHPEKICETILNNMVDKLFRKNPQGVQGNTLLTQRNESPELASGSQPSTTQMTGAASGIDHLDLVDASELARFLHYLGSVALNLAVFLETHVLLELKIRKALANDENINNISAHNISISSRRRSRRYGAGNKSVDDQNLEEEIGLGGAEAEDTEAEVIGRICDEEVVCKEGLLAKLSVVIVQVVMRPEHFHQLELKQAALLALAKFMMVSAKFCSDHLRLLFTALERSEEKEIKINILIAISDLCIRFPNLLDCWTSKIFDCLQSREISVRRTALKIVSRLVLCDILKPKNQISTIANLIVDEDDNIASLSRYFFIELSKKLNAIYNVLPDIISRLSNSETGISEENFRTVMRFIFELIDKSSHIDRLVDKLCGRFMDTDDERHWSDLAFCLSLLKYSDKSMAKLFDKFDCFKDRLCFDSVREPISLTISNYRKTPNLRNEMKQMLDEFEAKIEKVVNPNQQQEEEVEEQS